MAYIPTKSVNLKDVVESRIRLGILGEPGTGKTTAALTFPNPVDLDFDNGLSNFLGQNVISVPFHDYTYVSQTLGYPPKQTGAQPNRRDAVLKFLREEAIKLETDQTLVLDSWSTLQDAFDVQTALEPAYTKQMTIDEYDFWARKIEFSRNVCTYLMSLKCNVVVIFHEQKVRDNKTQQILDKIAPVMQGKFVTQLKVYFPDFFRAVVQEQKRKDEKTGKEFREKVNYLWQVKSDSLFDAKSTLKKVPENQVYIPATYQSYIEHK